MIIVLIVLAVIALFLVFKFVKAEKFRTHLVCLSGTMGSGKTLCAVSKAKNEYKRLHFFWKLHSIIAFWDINRYADEPVFYSNIPVRISAKKISEPVTYEHLILERKFTENCVVVIDEMSVLADQHQWDDPNVCERLGKLIKFYRHWTGKGRLYITEQSVSDVVKPVRNKLGEAFNLTGCHRLLGVLPFFVFDCIKVRISDGDVNEDEEKHEIDKKPSYLICFVPYFSKGKTYNSRCYRPIYHEGASDDVSDYLHSNKLDTRYLIDISSSEKRKESYKKSKENERKFLYSKKKRENSDDNT